MHASPFFLSPSYVTILSNRLPRFLGFFLSSSPFSSLILVVLKCPFFSCPANTNGGNSFNFNLT